MNNSLADRCPKCGSKEVQRSRRKNILEFMFGFAFLPWRCQLCFNRYYRPSWVKAARRRIDVAKQFQAQANAPKAAAASAGADQPPSQSSFSSSKQTSPGVVERNPVLGFFPTGRQMRHVQDAVTFRAKQFGS